MHYQIFIPTDAPKAPQQLLIDVGLSDHIAGHEPRANSQGPEEKMGTLFAWRKPGANQRFHFNANEQTWIPAVQQGESPGGRYWVGFWNDSPVAPEDIQKPYSLPGEKIELGDGNTWRVPLIDALPRDYIRDDDGSWKFETQRQYYDLWLECSELKIRILETRKVSEDWDIIVGYCEKILQQNYRMPTEVVSHLRLLNSTNIMPILGSALDLTLAYGD